MVLIWLLSYPIFDHLQNPISSKYFHDLTILFTASITIQLQATITSFLDNFNSLFVSCASSPPSSALPDIACIVPLHNENLIVLLFCSLPSTGFLTCYHLQGATCLHPLSPPHFSHLISYHFSQYFTYTRLYTFSWTFQACSHLSALMTFPQTFAWVTLSCPSGLCSHASY